MLQIGLLTLLVALGASQEGKPALTLKTYPRNAVRPSEILLSLSLEGKEEEKYYCPEVEWEFGGLRATEYSDCQPYDKRDEYPRRWSKRVGLGCGDWPIRARILNNGKTLLSAEALVRIICEG